MEAGLDSETNSKHLKESTLIDKTGRRGLVPACLGNPERQVDKRKSQRYLIRIKNTRDASLQSDKD